MALYLATGQPGHGKTAYALDKAFTWQKEGRKIYAHGVKDLDYERAGFTYLEDPTKWEELPDGSVILLDECYTIFPNRNPGSKVPPHVEAMARHRHRGFDFILVAQQGLQLDPFLRGLYEEHVHVRQTSMMKSKTKLKRWNQYQGNVQGPCNDVIDWIRPAYVFGYYTSTTLVTTKRAFPTWMRALLIGIVLLFATLLGIKYHYSKKISDFEEQRQASLGAASTLPAVGKGRGEAADTTERIGYETPADYAVAHLARFPSMPWTAPIFDTRAVVSNPQLLCMASDPGELASGEHGDAACVCLTEQGTVYEMPTAQCLKTARQGPAYNPYKMPGQMAAPAPLPASAGFPVATAAALPGVGEKAAGPRYGQFRDEKPGPEHYTAQGW